MPARSFEVSPPARGVWYNNEQFTDQRFDNMGLPLASPLSTNVPAQHKGDYSFYVQADQMVWTPNPGESRSIGVFARVMGAPGGDARDS